MAEIDVAEIEPGLVAYLDQVALVDDPAVINTLGQSNRGVRPMVCVKVEGESAWWAPLTTAFRRERVPIKSDWREGGTESWKGFECYLNDGASVYVGPLGSFASASQGDQTDVASRSRLSEEGLSAIKDEIEKQARRRTIEP